MKNGKLRKIFNALVLTGFVGVAGTLSVETMIGHENAPAATQTLKQMGYHDIKITGKGSYWSCSRDRLWYRTAFSAVNGNGVKETGTACAGFVFYPATTIKLNN